MIAFAVLLALVVPLALIGLTARFVMRRIGSDAPVARTIGAAAHIGVVVAAVNAVSGLLELVVDGDAIVRDTPRIVALNLAVLVVAAPVSVVMWRSLFSDRTDFPRRFAVVGGLSANLVVAVFSAVAVAESLVGLADLDPSSAANLVAFGGAWAAYSWWRRSDEPERFEVDDLPATVASAIGLGLSASAAVLLIETALSRLIGVSGDIVFQRSVADALLMVAVMAVIGGSLLARFWWMDLSVRETRFRNGYGAVVSYFSLTAFASAVSALAFVTLEWAFGAGADRASQQFEPVPVAVAIAVVSGLAWWHHLGTIDPRRGLARRAYSYAAAATGVMAAASGLTALLVVALESITAVSAVATSEVASITIASLIGVIAGAVLWWSQWREVDATVLAERDSTPRRVYLVGLLVVAGIAGGVSLVTAIFGLLQAALEADLGLDVIHDGRFVIAIVVVAAPLIWHLVGELRSDRASRPGDTPRRRAILVAGDAGRLADLDEVAVLRVGDGGFAVSESMAARIEELLATAGSPLLLVVREDGFETVELEALPASGPFGIFG